MPIRAALQIHSGFACPVAEMSKRGRDVTILNPMYLPHWIDVKSVARSNGHFAHIESVRKLPITGACSSCSLIPICKGLRVHITKFQAVNGRVTIEVVSTTKSYGSFLKQITNRYKFDVCNARAAVPEKGGFGLTPRRLKAVRMAFAQGYYDFPREVSLAILQSSLVARPLLWTRR